MCLSKLNRESILISYLIIIFSMYIDSLFENLSCFFSRTDRWNKTNWALKPGRAKHSEINEGHKKENKQNN